MQIASTNSSGLLHKYCLLNYLILPTIRHLRKSLSCWVVVKRTGCISEVALKKSRFATVQQVLERTSLVLWCRHVKVTATDKVWRFWVTVYIIEVVKKINRTRPCGHGWTDTRPRWPPRQPRGHTRLDARSTDVGASSQDNAAGGRVLGPSRQSTCPTVCQSVSVGDICVRCDRN